ncbi:MAG: hypothetical protein WD042_19820 [Phycisphaeraceae bacterium]
MNNTSKLTALTLAALLTAGAVLPGCSGSQARVIEADKEGIVRADRVDVQDFESASGQMLTSLYSSGALERAPRQPAVVAFSRIVNDTGEMFDTDLLTVRVIEQLQNGGKVQLNTTFGTNPRDAAGGAVQDQRDFMNDTGTASRQASTPDFTLIGKIMKNTARHGNVKQATYTFQLMLTDTRTGLSAWIAQRQITKQGSRPAVGI